MPPQIEPTAAQREQAALWLARRAGGSMTAADETNFADWIARDPNHSRAYRDAEDLWNRLDVPAQRLAAGIAADHIRVPRSPRHASWPLLSLAVMLVVALGASLGLFQLPGSSADVVTARGEHRVLGLPDGSRINVGPDSALDLDFAGRRIVKLLRGEVYFEIRPGHSQPFLVELGDANVEVTGTKFDIDRRDSNSIVAVLEGSVEVRDTHARSVHLESGRRALVQKGEICCIGAVDSDAVTAWMSRRLVFDNASLADVVTALRRRTTARILVMGNDVHVKVSGTFPADDVQNSLDTIASATGLKILHFSRLLTILY